MAEPRSTAPDNALPSSFKLENQTICVTGANRGIGLEVRIIDPLAAVSYGSSVRKHTSGIHSSPGGFRKSFLKFDTNSRVSMLAVGASEIATIT
jgi:hypothetical protein